MPYGKSRPFASGTKPQLYFMQSLFILLSSLAVLSLSCTGKKEPPGSNQAVPEALQDDKRSETGFFKSSSRHQNIIEELYEELVAENPSLQDLEKNIQDVKISKQDSARAFAEFDQKNNNYYNTTEQYINSIADTALKQNIRTLISRSIEKYNFQVQPNKALLEIIGNKDIKLSDLHKVLKLTKTVAVMEKYQQSSQPSVHPLQVVNREYDSAIEQTKKLTAN
jgi:uncharacterized protein YdiU (UPF0061 family)